MSRATERVLLRIERAGGAMSEASKLADEHDGLPSALGNAIFKLNVGLGDLRRAIVRFENGDDINDILSDLDRQLREVGNNGPSIR